MERAEIDREQIGECCEIGVKSACATCDYSPFCNGKWSHTRNGS